MKKKLVGDIEATKELILMLSNGCWKQNRRTNMKTEKEIKSLIRTINNRAKLIEGKDLVRLRDNAWYWIEALEWVLEIEQEY